MGPVGNTKMCISSTCPTWRYCDYNDHRCKPCKVCDARTHTSRRSCNLAKDLCTEGVTLECETLGRSLGNHTCKSASLGTTCNVACENDPVQVIACEPILVNNTYIGSWTPRPRCLDTLLINRPTPQPAESVSTGTHGNLPPPTTPVVYAVMHTPWSYITIGSVAGATMLLILSIIVMTLLLKKCSCWIFKAATTPTSSQAVIVDVQSTDCTDLEQHTPPLRDLDIVSDTDSGHSDTDSLHPVSSSDNPSEYDSTAPTGSPQSQQFTDEGAPYNIPSCRTPVQNSYWSLSSSGIGGSNSFTEGSGNTPVERPDGDFVDHSCPVVARIHAGPTHLRDDTLVKPIDQPQEGDDDEGDEFTPLNLLLVDRSCVSLGELS